MRSFITYAALTASAYAVTLQDFKPRVSGLPAACQLVYTTPILGCSASDFAGKGCSDNCISGMVQIGPAVVLACSTATLPGNDVITAYLQGKAVKNQCPNAPDSTTSTTQQQTPTPTSTSTSTADATTTTPSSTDTPTTSSTLGKVAPTSSTSTSSSTSSSSVTSNSNGSSSSPAGTSSSSSSSSTTSSTRASSTPGNVSGGGSPFDTASNTAASLSGPASAFAFFSSALLAGYLL